MLARNSHDCYKKNSHTYSDSTDVNLTTVFKRVKCMREKSFLYVLTLLGCLLSLK